MLNNQKISAPLLIEDLGILLISKRSLRKTRYGIYKCSCGNEFKAITTHIKNGHTQSCGCYQKRRASESHIKHGLSTHRLYHVWKSIIFRTTNINDPQFLNYGGRGIKVCERWNKLENFIEDMYSSYKEGLKIDRIDNDGNYEPLNCRWTTQTVQSRNTQVLQKNNTSGYRGSTFCKKDKKWRSQITINYSNIFLGNFDTALEAAKAYDTYVIENNLEHTINGVLHEMV